MSRDLEWAAAVGLCEVLAGSSTVVASTSKLRNLLHETPPLFVIRVAILPTSSTSTPPASSTRPQCPDMAERP